MYVYVISYLRTVMKSRSTIFQNLASLFKPLLENSVGFYGSCAYIMILEARNEKEWCRKLIALILISQPIKGVNKLAI